MTLFLIDDDSEEAELFGEAVSSIDSTIKVKSFDNGADALAAMQRTAPPDMVFLDLNMPVLSGKDVLYRMRGDGVSGKIPVVIYSTSISKNDIEETKAFGVWAYLQKPEDFVSLCRELKSLLLPGKAR